MAIAGLSAMTTKQKPVATPEQRRAANPHASAWVAASAGSGKTQVLVDRVIRLLLEGAEPQAILCLTFTKAAAAEMANRLYQRLSGWIACSDATLDAELESLGIARSNTTLRAQARRLFARALETPGGLKIQTIHAFCERLLQLFPVESGMAPGFRVLDDQDAETLLDEAFLASLASEDPSTKAAWSFLGDVAITSLDSLKKTAKPFLSGAAGVRQNLGDMAFLDQLENTLRIILGTPSDVTSDDIMHALCEIDERAYESAIDTIMPLERDAGFNAALHLKTVVAAKNPEARTTALADLVLTGQGNPRASLLRKPAKNKEPATALWLDSEKQRILEHLDQLAAQQTLEANLLIYKAMAGVLARLNIAKRSRGLFDFDDLIARTSVLLNSSEAAQWVLYKLDKGLTHILVDEAQDTSPAQWTIIQALAGEFFTGEQTATPTPRTVFAVGDLKQSIFSFQGADVSAFATAREGFEAALEQVGGELEKVDLTISYRSTAEVLAVVDQVFRDGSFARTGFGARAHEERPHTAFHSQRQGVFELWDLIAPEDAEEPDYWAAPVDRPPKNHPRLILAERIAKTIAGWIGKRRLVARGRAVQAGDILILLQSRNALFAAIISALRRQGVPVSGADRLSLQNSLIVHDLLALGQLVRMPDDDHALACVLKSPLVPRPLSETQLFELAYGRQDKSLWQRLSETPRHTENYQALQECVDRAAQGPHVFFAFISQRSKRAILRRLGREAEDALAEFLSLTLDFEQQQGTSLVGFLDWMSGNEKQIKREMDTDTGEVRLMTVHGSKGLEAPIVFLADAADLPNPRSERIVKISGESPWRGLPVYQPKTLMTPAVIEDLKTAEKAAAIAERMRLLYVGMTRAADELYVCGSYNDKQPNKDCWYNQVASAFENLSSHLQLRTVQQPDGLIVRRYGAEPQAVDASPDVAQQPKSLPHWAVTALEPHQALPLLPTRKPSSFDAEAAKRGIATHKLVELMVDAEPAERREVGLRVAESLTLEPELALHVAQVLAKPELAVFLEEAGQSEVTIEGRVPGLGHIVGRIDRLVILPDEIYLLDYKTDRQPPATLANTHPYVRQMARYGAALQAAYPRHRLKAALLWTQTGDITWLEPELLSRATDQLWQETA
jgi:ATP-dependent helicase/nuclease subunit A